MFRRIAAAFAAIVASCLIVGEHSSAQDATAFGAAAGLAAGARVDAFVTRMQGTVPVTLPAAAVPALEQGDQVTVRFPDYTRPPASVKYHVNVAFLTQVAPQHWLFQRSGAEDRLFNDGPPRDPATTKAPVDFVYGVGTNRGIPVVLIVPEDPKTRGMDGVRDYVAAHPNEFKNMSESSNDAVERYSWFRDFLASLSNGSLDPRSAQQRITDVARSLGASPSAVDACFASAGPSAVVAACVKSTLTAVQYTGNVAAPTQGQFFGGLASAAIPAQFAFYLEPMLAIWKIFATAGHHEYEYLPASLHLAAPYRSGVQAEQLLLGVKVPTLRPPAAYSSVVFFTIGDDAAAASPPAVGADTTAAVCARTERVGLPIHLLRTSTFVNDTALVVTPDGAPSYRLPIDPGTAGAPEIARSDLRPGSGTYSVRLEGRFGFDPLAQADRSVARLVVPGPAAWKLSAVGNRAPAAGGTLDVIAEAPVVPCVSEATLRIGDSAPLPLERTVLDDRRIELKASLNGVPPGDARIVLSEDDPVGRARIETSAQLAIAPPPARVDPARPATASLGDRQVTLFGTEFEAVTELQLNGASYKKDPGSTADVACFTGPPVGGGVPGQTVSARFLERSGEPGEVFAVKLAPARPALGVPAVSGGPVHLSTDLLTIDLNPQGRALPLQRDVLLRRASPGGTCAAAAAADVVATIPASDVRETANGGLTVLVQAAAALGDRAYGTLQIAVADAETKLASDWRDIPGKFVRAPAVSRIECPTDVAAPCAMYGAGLEAILFVELPSGSLVRPDPNCPGRASGTPCVLVPRAAQYKVRLADAEITIPVPVLPTAPQAAQPPQQPAPAH